MIKQFKFLKTNPYKIIGILSGYIDDTLNFSEIKPFSVELNGQTYQSEVMYMSYNEFRSYRINHPEIRIEFCAIFDDSRPMPEKVEDYFTVNNLNRLNQILPSIMYQNPNTSYYIEIIKLPI